MINNIKKNVKNTLIDIIILILNFSIVFSYFVKKQVNNLDEIWNFNTARQIMNGLIPYKEISMITTSLLPSLNALFLKVAGDQLFIFRILTALMVTCILFCIYKLISELTNNKRIAIIIIQAILLVWIDYFFLDYNFFSLLLFIIIEFIEIKSYKNKNEKMDILIGILAGLTICTKQTIGCFIALFVILLPLINNRQDNIKKRIYKVLFRILGISIPLIIFLFILIITNSVIDFINYAILGIKTFNNVIPYKTLLQNNKVLMKILAVTSPIFIIIMVIFEFTFCLSKKLYRQDEICKINILVLYCFPMLITIYPIADNVHFIIAILPIIISAIYICFEIMMRLYEKMKWVDKKYVAIFIQITAIIVMTINITKSTISNYKTYYQSPKTAISHYQGLNISERIEKSIESLRKFYDDNLKDGRTVILTDAAAAIYNIPLDVYHKNYDMFLKGNIGKDGEEGIIENIKDSTNCIYLVKKEGLGINWQTPIQVIYYIRNNLERLGSIDIFDVYYKE